MSSHTQISVERILHPDSVAVFGASDNKDKYGGRIAHYILKHGYQGRLVPINPGRQEVLGRPCYPNIGAAPGPVDVAILAVPPTTLVESVAECAAAGVGCCVILTVGFAESGSVAGARMQEELVRISARSGTRLVGPNCLGLINPHHHLALTSSITMEVPELIPGSIGLVSQSGALLVSMHNRATASGIGFSACVSLGNQADLEICDFLEYLVDDPKTAAICLYVEGFRDAQRFLRGAEAAKRAGKPLLMVKTGRTEAGVRAARSHTASLAGSYPVLEAACRERGVLLLDDPEGMIYTADVLARWGPPPGDGLGVISPSGGSVSICSDRVVEAGIRLAELSPVTRDRLGDLLIPPQVANPIDLGGRREGDPVVMAGQAMTALAEDPDVSALLIVLSSMPFFTEVSRSLAEAGIASGKPVVAVVTPGSAGDGPRRVLTELGCRWYDRLDDAIRIFRGWTEYGRLRPRPLPDPGSGPRLGPLPESAAGHLAEPEAKRLLEAAGVPVNRTVAVASAADAAVAAERLGFPVAVKVLAAGLIHKSDAGGVRLGLTSAEAVRAAYAETTTLVPGSHGCTVQEMAAGELELIVGARRDPQFGPVVAVGLGGLYAEVLRDVQLALAPVSQGQAREMLERLRCWPLLAGARGRPLDVDAVAEAVWRMSWLAAELGDALEDVEVNPLLVRAAGEGVTAVDARANLVESGE